MNKEPILRFLVDRPYRWYRRAGFVLILLILLKGGNEEHRLAFTDQLKTKEHPQR